MEKYIWKLLFVIFLCGANVFGVVLANIYRQGFEVYYQSVRKWHYRKYHSLYPYKAFCDEILGYWVLFIGCIALTVFTGVTFKGM